jgi:McrBC 5-methylcytosine restriction system component
VTDARCKSAGRRPVSSPRAKAQRLSFVAPAQKLLLTATDHGHPVTVPPAAFAPEQRGGGWGLFSEIFLRMNETSLRALDVRAELAAGPGGASVRLVPAGRAGAVPLRSAQNGNVAGGLVVRPRFGWAGVGRVLSEIGWYTAPEFLDAPLVPGSGREVPPWVLAGPVLARLADLLHSMRRGYSDIEAVVQRPRGRILWNRYCSESVVRGRWQDLPCRFPELGSDARLRRAIRWTLERILRDLMRVGARDPVSTDLARIATGLIKTLLDVVPVMPAPNELARFKRSSRLMESVVRQGLEAMGWIVDERGLGGGRELDGLAWQLPLDQLWEEYVEAVIRKEAAMTGGEVKVGRLGETVFPLDWSVASHRTLGHLRPDIVVRQQHSVHVVDAKYKAHLAELDETGWRRFAEEQREAHRADLHQVLAYASLYNADEITATLIYPMRLTTWQILNDQKRDISRAELFRGGRRIVLELRGIPFGHGCLQ